MVKREKPIRGPKQRRREALGIAGAWLAMASVAGQGIAGILQGKYAEGENAWGQPVGAVLQVSLVVILTPFAVVWTIRSVRRMRAANSNRARTSDRPS